MLDTERLCREAWMDVAREKGLIVPENIYLHMVGRRSTDCQRILREHLGPDFPVDEYYHASNDAYHKRIAEAPPPCKPGITDLLKFLTENGIKRGVATSTHRELAEDKLSSCGLIDHFDVIVTGNEVAHGKPAPDIFLECARRLQVDPGNCVALEDSPSGLMAAHKAGMHAIMIPDLIAPDDRVEGVADAILNSLSDVSNYLLEQGFVD